MPSTYTIVPEHWVVSEYYMTIASVLVLALHIDVAHQQFYTKCTLRMYLVPCPIYQIMSKLVFPLALPDNLWTPTNPIFNQFRRKCIFKKVCNCASLLYLDNNGHFWGFDLKAYIIFYNIMQVHLLIFTT